MRYAPAGGTGRDALRDLGEEPRLAEVLHQILLRDVELLHIMAATVEATIPESKLYSPVGLVQQFDRSITAELNYLIEAENCDLCHERSGKEGQGPSLKDYASLAFARAILHDPGAPELRAAAGAGSVCHIASIAAIFMRWWSVVR